MTSETKDRLKKWLTEVTEKEIKALNICIGCELELAAPAYKANKSLKERRRNVKEIMRIIKSLRVSLSANTQ
jgi:hypothetical protein